jgi:REP element-mobilizing transposase RayT
MTMARRQIVHEGERGVYHCMARCVRQAYLCGINKLTGANFEDRRGWIRDRLMELSELFGIDVLSYSVMHNHHHNVIRTRPDVVEQLNDEEVVRRWLAVTPKHRKGTSIQQAASFELDLQTDLANPKRVIELRERLSSVSWFMKSLDENIARRSNKEEGIKGRFWEGRFKCQALLDEAAILTCMSYVDLNPVRAQLADSLGDSKFTSAYDRVTGQGDRQKLARLEETAGESLPASEEIFREDLNPHADDWLVSLDGDDSPFQMLDTSAYLQLLDATGRCIRADKRGHIDESVFPILQALDISTDKWASGVEHYGSRFYRVAGHIETFVAAASRAGTKFMKGKRVCGELFHADVAPATG